MKYPQPLDYKEIDKTLNYDEIEIIDNFLEPKAFDIVRKMIIGDDKQDGNVGWVYKPSIVDPAVEHYANGNIFQFIHTVYSQRHAVESPLCKPLLSYFLPSLDAISLTYAKLNAIPKTDKRYQHPWHTDVLPNNEKVIMSSHNDDPLKGDYKFKHIEEFKDMSLGKLEATLFYFNTTDAPTVFKDGTEVECIANRLVRFPIWYIHASTTPTDVNVRFVLNLNFL